jgi:hypothetical protein
MSHVLSKAIIPPFPLTDGLEKVDRAKRNERMWSEKDEFLYRRSTVDQRTQCHLFNEFLGDNLMFMITNSSTHW